MVEIRNLTKRYGTHLAVDDLSFTVEPGRIYGFLGPNGAGKSTTVKLMTGILTPSAGECVIGGRVPWNDRREHVRHLGAVFGQRTQLWWDVPILDSFELLRDVYALEEGAFRRRLEELVEGLEAAPRQPLAELGAVLELLVRLAGSGPPRVRRRRRGVFLHSRPVGRALPYGG